MNLEEIAHLAGVSRSTVSRVVNDDRRVSDAVRARVQAVIRAHNYHPHAAARGLASKRMRIIGMLASKAVESIFTDPFYPLLIQGTAHACNAVDYNLTMLIGSGEGESGLDRLYQRVIRGRHVDGIIIACHVVDEPIIDRLRADRFPFVLVGRHAGAINFVDVDNRGAARDAVAHLLAHGYRRVAAICGPNNLIASIDRYAGYVTALQEAGVPPDPSLAIFSDFTRQGAYRAALDLIRRPNGPPEAIFAASDSMAAGILRAVRDAGLRVPDDIAVMGFDDLAESTTTDPPLSTVAQPITEYGREVVRILLELIDNPDRAPEQIFMPTQLVLRRSCGCEMVALERATGGVTEETILVHA
ncbi:MAG: LacI family DNA-binding transcriptional regulator [Thermomicrobiales bacterium]